METAAALSRLYLGYGQAHMSLIFSSRTDEELAMVNALLQAILVGTGMPGQYPVDEDISEHSHYFWHIFVDTVASADIEVCPCAR